MLDKRLKIQCRHNELCGDYQWIQNSVQTDIRLLASNQFWVGNVLHLFLSKNG